MSPLKIVLLLRLYCHFDPMADYAPRQRHAPAMQKALRDFWDLGLLIQPLTTDYRDAPVRAGSPFPEKLTPKGLALVQKLKAIEP